MVQMTVEIPDELAARIRPLRAWLSTALELTLVGFRTRAAATAGEVIRFLSTEPSPQDILDYHVSAAVQTRLRRLLALNEAGVLGEAEQQELDELQQIEHIMVLLKARVAGQTPDDS